MPPVHSEGQEETIHRLQEEVAVLRVWPERAIKAETEVRRLRDELCKQEAVMVAADRLHEAYEAMVEGRDVGRLPDWQHLAGEPQR